MEPVLENRLRKIAERDLVHFHYPGHKTRRLGFSVQDLLSLDTTETYGTDDLLNPKGVIDQSQRLAAQAFGTLDSFYGVGGSTMAIYAALFALTQDHDHIVIQRNCHKSVYQGALLRKLKLRTIDPVYDRETDLLLGLDPQVLEEYLRTNPQTRVLVLTNPSYYGVIQDLKKLAQIAHDQGVLVLVDEAHGAHLPFSYLKEYSALRAGADIVVHSAHKSLASLTQTALLHRNSDRISREEVLEKITLFTSSSPSYLFMLSIEGAITKAQDLGAWEDEFLPGLEDFKSKAQGLGYEFFQPKEGAASVAYDYMKLFFRYPGYRGQELSDIFYQKGINFEMTDGSYVLGVLSQETNKEDLDRLLKAMASIPKGRKPWEKGIYQESQRKVGQEIYQACSSQGKWLDIDQVLGQVSRNFIYQYPPGIPLIIPGEVFTEQVIGIIKGSENLVGTKGSKVRVI